MIVTSAKVRKNLILIQGGKNIFLQGGECVPATVKRDFLGYACGFYPPFQGL
jgi:hypothetical protein